MLFRPLRPQRRGTVLAETAIVFTVVCALTIGMVVVGLGIFSYQQASCLAREGARWLAVRGTGYTSDTGNTAASTSNLTTYLKKMGDVGSVSAYLGNDTDGWVAWDSSTKNATNASGNQNWVKVTLTYQWTMYLGSGITMGSTAKLAMLN
jgi:Flp pilus assembly protein TadG